MKPTRFLLSNSESVIFLK